MAPKILSSWKEQNPVDMAIEKLKLEPLHPINFHSQPCTRLVGLARVSALQITLRQFSLQFWFPVLAIWHRTM